MKKLFLILFTIVLTASFVLCNTNSYDAYGQKTGSFKKDLLGRRSMINTEEKSEVISKLFYKLL